MRILALIASIATRATVVLAVAFVTLAVASTPAHSASSGAVDNDPALNCNEHRLNRNDDGSSSEIYFDFELNFYGDTYNSLWVNNNGNVTFDGPLSTYTPFDLSTTKHAIIAPFFADVDTRGANGGAVIFNYGDGEYQGQKAFCVVWYQVGYYSYGVDKVNTFQLIIVDRPESGRGSFDIIFNYDTIQWETGSASGGSGGLGGSSARVGFSNGTYSEYGSTTYEKSGSGRPGAFLDSNILGLANTSTNSDVTGRHVYQVRSGGVIGTKYVALGDSFSSGEGADDFYGETHTPDNRCHRSGNAYPVLLAGYGDIDYELDFWACSGSTISDLYRTTATSGDAPFNDPDRQVFYEQPDPDLPAAETSALDRLGPDTQVVTISIGGNDLDFFPVAQDCVLQGMGAPDDNPKPCAARNDATQQRLLEELEGSNRLTTLFRDIRRAANYADIYVIGYPRFFEERDERDPNSTCSAIYIRPEDQYWMNSRIAELNRVVEDAANKAHVIYVDVYDVGEGYEICNRSSGQEFMNRVQLSNVFGTLHPNVLGHQLLADSIARQMDQPGPWVGGTVYPGATSIFKFYVDRATTAYFSQSYEGSDIEMTLVSPSGVRIGADSDLAGVDYDGGATWDYFTIANPELGEWTVELFGASVAPAGEWTTIDLYQEPEANAVPVAAFSVSQMGRTADFDGSASTDADGDGLTYFWDFGDGEFGEGGVVTHRYAEPGVYWPTLMVVDPDGAVSVASTELIHEVPVYDFRGFDDSLTDRTFKAGQAIPVSINLAAYYGDEILAAGSPTAKAHACENEATTGEGTSTESARQPRTTYDDESGTYLFVLKSDRSWSGECADVEFTFTDGSAYTVTLHFK